MREVIKNEHKMTRVWRMMHTPTHQPLAVGNAKLDAAYRGIVDTAVEDLHVEDVAAAPGAAAAAATTDGKAAHVDDIVRMVDPRIGFRLFLIYYNYISLRKLSRRVFHMLLIVFFKIHIMYQPA